MSLYIFLVEWTGMYPPNARGASFNKKSIYIYSVSDKEKIQQLKSVKMAGFLIV